MLLTIGVFYLVLLGSGPESSLNLQRGWARESAVKSAFATQAACADETQIYAISSTTVAVYDRSTGKFLRKSEGLAKHLNSGFLWKGKVYCAHSNYPSRPEESEIKVYDPGTNKLTTFHRFDQPDGSLVWNVREAEHWWCCFAHYGNENAKTLLVKMNDQFEEKGRWTFPKIVVDDWDKMSASGGIWDGPSLLTTHHHFRVFYRLRLPRKGTELEFIEALKTPFPGQGIARDPTNPARLVGIDRNAQAVIFAVRDVGK